MLVRAEEEHGAVGVENVLRAVAVVDVPIGDQHAANAVLALRIARRDGDAVEEAKSHAARRRGVMARRPHDAESVSNALVEDRVHRVQDAAGGTQRSIQRARSDDRVAGAQLVKAGHDLALHQPDVRAAVAQRDFVLNGDARLDPREIQILNRAQRRIESLGALGMMMAGGVFFANAVGE